ncbi:hypothetical protein B0I35DRAFT_484758 [Stachybotrys elegans]|uniref:Uncharacterized protein n=1 Tax=Stachybotrys elegans TaxID=80388 RepID=A0A8K0SEJ2_9HYPO|nr:hypothetical protein B0I35DRAFT_484758 [Stachybotrys elegans]
MAPLVWLITGCSSGLGQEFVKQILARGDKVIATARRLESIESLQNDGASTLRLDVTDEPEVINKAISEAIGIYGGIDVLVNNAGFIVQGAVEELSQDQLWAEFNTNFFGTVKVTQAVLPHFRQRRAGALVFVGSLSGWIGHPYVAAYAASKFAVEGMAESIKAETEGFGIRTLLVEPGRFRTNLLTLGNLTVTEPKISDYKEAASSMIQGLAKEDRAQPGNPVKLISVVLDFVRNEGVAEGRPPVFRLPLGTDCYEEVKKKCEETLENLEALKDITTSCDF